MKSSDRHKCKRNGLFSPSSIDYRNATVHSSTVSDRLLPSAPTQAILVLGGGEDREEFAAQFAEFHPVLKIWVSSGSPPNKSRAIFQDAGIADSRVYLDYRATDTVTNFTTLVRVFQQ